MALAGRDVLVGAGGWDMYEADRLGSDMRLRGYAREFDFVEVNSTFYNIVHPETVQRWRKSVPDYFEFSVKCYEALTHKIGLRPVEDAFRVFAMMQKYCHMLGSGILVLQLPPSIKLDQKFTKEARDFFKSVNLGSLRIALEFRVMPGSMPPQLVAMLHDFNMAHTVDLTFEEPRSQTDLLYTRLFGQAHKQNSLDDKDLSVLKKQVDKTKAPVVRVVGHSLRMIEDARRIKQIMLQFP